MGVAIKNHPRCLTEIKIYFGGEGESTKPEHQGVNQKTLKTVRNTNGGVSGKWSGKGFLMKQGKNRPNKPIVQTDKISYRCSSSGKIRFRTEADAKAAAKKYRKQTGQAMNHYYHRYCDSWHIGHKRSKRWWQMRGMDPK